MKYKIVDLIELIHKWINGKWVLMKPEIFMGRMSVTDLQMMCCNKYRPEAITKEI